MLLASNDDFTINNIGRGGGGGADELIHFPERYCKSEKVRQDFCPARIVVDNTHKHTN